MVTACNRLLKTNDKFIVFSTIKKLQTKIIDEDFTLEDFLKKKKIQFHILKKIDDLNKKKYSNIFSKNLNPFGLSLSFEFIFKEKQINLFQKLYNFHGSFLPEMKGGGGWTWSMLMNKYSSGNSIHEINELIDAGKIICRERYYFPTKYRKSINLMNTYGKYKQNLFLNSFLKNLRQNKRFKKVLQNNNEAILWPKLDTYKDAEINWNWSIDEIILFIRAFGKPYRGAWSKISRNKIFIFEVSKKKFSHKFHPFQYGIIINISKKNIHVACKEGILIITNYEFEKKTNKINSFIGKKFTNFKSSLK